MFSRLKNDRQTNTTYIVVLLKKSLLRESQVLNRMNEQTPCTVVSKIPFNLWGEIFNYEIVASAILDRLLHHPHPVLISGKASE